MNKKFDDPIVKKSYRFFYRDNMFYYQEVFVDGVLHHTKWKNVSSKSHLGAYERNELMAGAIEYFKNNHPIFKNES
jgi:hypothetical protein